MIFDPPLLEATLIQRYKRFLADVRLADGEELTVHCPNPGAMLGLSEPGNRVWISDSRNPKRKLQYTLELMEVDGPDGKTLVGINTMHPNKLAAEAITSKLIPELAGYDVMRKEVRYGENSRIDILLESPQRRPCYVEIKNVHLMRQNRLHEFPDCKTARGAKHLNEMAAMVSAGARAVMLYVIQREDGDRFALARDMDPHYVMAYENATAIGVEALAIRCKVSTQQIVACDPIPIVAP